MHVRFFKCLALCALLAAGFQGQANGQTASDRPKAQRLAFYRGKVLAHDYDYLVGTYQKENEPQVRALLNSLGLQYHFLNQAELRKIWPQFSSQNPDGAKPLQIRAQQGAFAFPALLVDPHAPSPVYSSRDDFNSSNPFQVQWAILQVARSPWVDDFVLANDEAGGGVNSVGYDFDRRVFFDDPDNPNLRQAQPRLTAMLEKFFGQFRGAYMTLIASDSNDFLYTLTVEDLHSAVVPNLKDAEILTGSVTLAPRFGTKNLFVEVIFDGSYAPMPDDRRPPKGRYADFQPEYGEALDRFGQKLTAFLQSQYNAIPRDSP
jgi:hypothetical protein